MSPSDVLSERDAAANVVDQINREVAHSSGVHLELIRWESHSFPGVHHEGPQGIIDERMQIADSDLVIAVLWSRFGTPTRDGSTGTQHELYTAWNAWREEKRPQVFVYRCVRGVQVRSTEDATQLAALMSFRDEIIGAGHQFIWDYTSVEEFGMTLRRHLAFFLKERQELQHPTARSNHGSARALLPEPFLDGACQSVEGRYPYPDPELVAAYRSELRPSSIESSLTQLDDAELLSHLGVLDADGALTRSGVLLFANEPAKFIPSAVVQCASYDGIEKSSRREIVTYSGPVVEQIEHSLEFVRVRTSRLFSPTEGSARSDADTPFPLVCLREVIANAIAHRDYEDANRVVHVRVFFDRVEISSPGYPIVKSDIAESSPLTVLTGPSVKRNLRLARLLGLVRLVEGEGSGIPTGVRNAQSMGAPIPTIALEGGFTVVTVLPRNEPTNIGLNDRYTFETFVKGQSNQFALAAAMRVGETPGRSYNPLFIYGAAGLGKTHLLHAIGHYVHRHYPHDVVRYVSTETFLNEYVDAIRSNATSTFKRRYRDIDVLLIDDIQFLEGKEGLQEEFFHTFNALHGANKQVVIASDRMPDAIPTLEERLRGRFKWGLITDVKPPDMETRLAILRNKTERDHSPVPAETLEFIAANVTRNIRELEGALIRISAYASLNQVPITPQLTEALLRDLLIDSPVRVRTDEGLLAELAIILGQSVEALRGRGRERPLVASRQLAMYMFRDLTDLSYSAIGRLFGGRDHSTVAHSVENITRLMTEHKHVHNQVVDLRQRILAG